jgi:hypothetical protein
MIHHQHGVLTVRIERHNNRTQYVVMLAAITAAFVFFMYTFVRPFFRGAAAKYFLYVSPFIAFVLLWYIIGLRLTVWRAFGIEQIRVEGGLLRWTRTALFWRRKLEVPAADVTDVKAMTPWHGLNNRVEVTVRGRRRIIGDMLLRDEATQLAHELKHTASLLG